ncbi:EVE domain-containing protein [bacterium]|nr:EVE domain-containing protein [bacterium]
MGYVVDIFDIGTITFLNRPKESMLEKDIENLVALYPHEFFPNENLSLIGQQYSIEGKRVDILFEDNLKRKLIVEIKRGILTREASGQIAEYYGLLKSKNQNEYYEMLLCANVIPKERRIFLEHIGIECKELGIALISEIAKKYQYEFSDEEPSIKIPAHTLSPDDSAGKNTKDNEEISVWIFQGNPQRYDILNALADNDIGNNIHWLVNQHKNKIKKGHIGLLWMSGPEAGIYAITRINNDPKLMTEYAPEKKYWIDSSKEHHEAMRVEMTIIKKLVNYPILKKKLVGIKDLENLSIFKQFQGTNFPVRNAEWHIISKYLPG